jgi:hypothetical protein
MTLNRDQPVASLSFIHFRPSELPGSVVQAGQAVSRVP